MSTGKLTIERVYLITGLSVFEATCAELAASRRASSPETEMADSVVDLITKLVLWVRSVGEAVSKQAG
ncbi:hypothetical protein [Streptomyces sp. NPDC057690]|uniref:hypothetical protein n=1 Tax=Streptomyces sp. NPDC057690 TaxID=3346214 RepID=UPI00368B84BB